MVDKINSDKFGKDKSYEGKTILVSTITSAIPLNATTATRNKKQLSVEEAALLNDKIIDDNPITEEEALGFRPESNLLKFRMPSYYDRSLTSSGLGEKQKSYQYMMRSLPTSETADLFNYEMGFLPLSSLTSMPKELTLFADDVFSLSFDFTKQLTKAKEGAEPDPRSIFSGLEENKTSKKVSFTGYVKVDVPCSNCEVKFPIQFNGTLIANDSEQKQKLNTSKDVRCEFSSIRSEGIWRLNVGYQPMLYSGGNARFGKGQRYIRDAIIIDGLNISLIPVYARCRPIASKIEHSKATYDFDKSPDVLFGSSSQMRNAYDHIRTNSNFASYVALSNEDEENKRTATITAVSQSRIIVGFYAVPTQILDFETSRYPTANFADLEKAYNQLTENFENNRKLDANMCKRLISLAVVYHFSKGFASVGSLSKFLPFFVLSDVPQEIETYASSIFVQNNDRQFLDESVKTLLYTKDSEIKDKVNNLLPFTSEDGLGKEMGDFLKGRTQVEAFETNSVPSSVFAQMHYVRDLRRLAGLDVEDSNDFDNQKDVGENV